MTALFFMNFFTSMIDVYLLYYFLKRLSERSEKKKSQISLLLGLLVICNTAINTTIGLVNIVGFFIMVTLLILVFNFIFDKNKLLKTFILLSTGMILMFLIELIVVNGISLFFRLSPKVLLNLNYYRVMAVILAKALFLGVMRLRRETLKEVLNWIKELSIYPILLLIIVNLLIVFMAFIFYTYADATTKDELIYVLSMGLAAIIVSSIILWIIRKMIDQQKKELVWRLKEKEYENQKIYLQHIQEIIQTLRAQRHDFNNYVSTIYGLIHLGKVEDAKKYILNLSEDVSDLNEVIDVCHPIIGAILNMKKERARRGKIDFKVDINIPMELPFDFMGLSIILGNLLDNAIEACEKIPYLHPKIHVQIYMKDLYMIIKIENNKSNKVVFSQSQLETPFTTKDEKENHGLGLMNVKKVVNLYKGIIKIQDIGSKFLVDVALPAVNDAKI